jgi:hypothetical protein
MARTDDESKAIWANHQNGYHWVKQIIRGCNLAIRKGKGNADTVKRISYDLETDEGANPSLSVTSYIKRFKKLVRENRTKDLLNKENNFKVQGYRQVLYNSEQYGNADDIPGESEEPKPKKARTTPYGPSIPSISDNASKPKEEAEAAFCNGCGIIHVFYKGNPGTKVCRFLYMKHPDYNSEDKPWADSTKGKAYAAKKLKCLSDVSCLNKGEIVPWTKPIRPRNQNYKGSNDRTAGIVNAITYADINTPKVLDKVILPVLFSCREGTTRLKARALLDPGATNIRSLITKLKAEEVVKTLGVELISNDKCYKGFGGGAGASSQSFIASVIVIFDQHSDCQLLHNITFDIVDELPTSECIISFPDLVRNQMFWRIPTGNALNAFLPENAPENRLHPEAVITQHEPYFICNIRDDELPHVSELLEFEADTFGEPEKYDALDEALQEPTPGIITTPEGPQIGGSKKLRKALRKLLDEHISLLQSEVSKTPAKIPPMKLKVDERQWTSAKTNTQRYRIQSAAKDAECGDRSNSWSSWGSFNLASKIVTLKSI